MRWKIAPLWCTDVYQQQFPQNLNVRTPAGLDLALRKPTP